jgi:hypothetical protein
MVERAVEHCGPDVTMEGDLEWAPALVPPSPATNLYKVIETLEGLQLHPSENRAPERGQPHGPGLRGLEHQIAA